MNIKEATEQACKEPTLLKALTSICVWESERVVEHAIRAKAAGEPWETCFGFCISSVMDKYEVG
jgi:hypothetical protein